VAAGRDRKNVLIKKKKRDGPTLRGREISNTHKGKISINNKHRGKKKESGRLWGVIARTVKRKLAVEGDAIGARERTIILTRQNLLLD